MQVLIEALGCGFLLFDLVLVVCTLQAEVLLKAVVLVQA
tara:strand:- start:2987 stop:3103 length:117 start_codon:yes stop_codon:yes gene_type:complete